MNLNDVLVRRNEPRWMNAEPPPYGYGGNSPRTEISCVICCNKCEEKVLEEIGEVYGVQDVVTDQARSEVIVYGYADSHEVLKKARKIDKRANIMSSDSFTLHHSKGGYGHGHGHKNKIHHKHGKHYKYDKHNRSHGHGHGLSHGLSHGLGHSYNGRSNLVPIESVGSPRYNSSFNQFRRSGGSSYDVPDYRPSYYQCRPREQEYRHIHDGYRSEPEFNRHHYIDRYRPHSEYRSMYDDYRPEHEHHYRYSGYRPSQSYPPSYVDERDYPDLPYPEMNPDYMKPLDYYY